MSSSETRWMIMIQATATHQLQMIRNG